VVTHKGCESACNQKKHSENRPEKATSRHTRCQSWEPSSSEYPRIMISVGLLPDHGRVSTPTTTTPACGVLVTKPPNMVSFRLICTPPTAEGTMPDRSDSIPAYAWPDNIPTYASPRGRCHMAAKSQPKRGHDIARSEDEGSSGQLLTIQHR
jgi:hypothetical protein